MHVAMCEDACAHPTKMYPAWSAPTITQNTTANNGMLMPMSSLRPGPSRACFSVAAVLRVATILGDGLEVESLSVENVMSHHSIVKT